MTPQQTDLRERIKAVAVAALDAGVQIDDSPTGPLATWIRANVSYHPTNEFFIVFLTGCEMADEQARREGYRDQYERAWAIIDARHKAQAEQEAADANAAG